MIVNRRLEGAEGAGRRRIWWAREGGFLPPPEGLSGLAQGDAMGIGLSFLIPAVFFGFLLLKGMSKVR